MTTPTPEAPFGYRLKLKSRGEIGLFDIYKMYVDRIAALRTIMIALVAATGVLFSALVAVLVNWGEIPSAGLAIGLLLAGMAALLTVASLLVAAVNGLIDEYERRYGAALRKYVLPLDSLRTNHSYRTENRPISMHPLATLAAVFVVSALVFGTMLYMWAIF